MMAGMHLYPALRQEPWNAQKCLTANSLAVFGKTNVLDRPLPKSAKAGGR